MDTKQKPLVVQIIPTLGLGGAEREVARLPGILNERSPYRVMVCCLWGRGVFAEELEKAGIEVAVLSERKGSMPVNMWRLLRFLRERKPLIAHSHLLRWSPLIAKLAGVPVAVMSEHNWTPKPKWYNILYERMNTYFADKVIAVAEVVRKQRIERWHIPADKVVLLPSSIDPHSEIPSVSPAAKRAELGIPDGAPIVSTAGRLVQQKRQDQLIDAALEVLKVSPDCRFLILGDGPLRGSLEAQIHRMGLETRVHMLGFRSDAREIMQITDVFCLSSDWEGTPMTVMEAMACRKPVVVTAVGGCPDVVRDGGTGYVVPPRDPRALAEAILKLLDEPELAKRMGDAGFDHLQAEYSVEVNLSRLLKLYEDALSEKGLAGHGGNN